MDDSLEETIKDLAQELKPFIAKSYLEERARLKQDALECCQGLEDLLDMDGLEAGKWSMDDEGWLLKEGKTVEDAIRLILARGLFFTRDIIKLNATSKLCSEGYFSHMEGKAFTSSILLKIPPVELIKNMLDYDYLSLFECIFLVGYDTDNFGITGCSIDIASQAIMGGTVSPRDPKTNLKMKDLPKQRLTGEPVLPDLSWLLSFEEAEQWAVNNFALSFKALKSKFKNPPEELASQKTQNKPDDTTPTEEQGEEKLNIEQDKPLDPRERQTLLAIIAALCKKQGISPCDRGLASELEKLTELLVTKRSEKTIKEHLDKAGQLFE